MKLNKYFIFVFALFIFSIVRCSDPDWNEDHRLFSEYWAPLMDSDTNAYMIWSRDDNFSDFDIGGDYIYYCDYYYPGLFSVVDASDKTDVREVYSLTNVYGYHIAVSSGYCYMTTLTNDILIFSLTDPANPVLSGNMGWDTVSAGAIQAIEASGDYLYVDSLQDGTNVLITLDLSSPGAPAIVSISSNYTTNTKVSRLIATKNWLIQWLGYGNAGELWFYNLANPSAPAMAETINYPAINNVDANDSAVYVCSGYELKVITLPPSGAPYEAKTISEVMNTSNSLHFYGIAVDDRYAVVSCYYSNFVSNSIWSCSCSGDGTYENVLKSVYYDLEDPLNPVFIDNGGIINPDALMSDKAILIDAYVYMDSEILDVGFHIPRD